MNYADNCLRGIPNSDYINHGYVLSHLFYFKDTNLRVDGWITNSINWQDDDSAIQYTLNQKDEQGDLQFEEGVAIISRAHIDEIKKLPSINSTLDYERDILPDNQYHGNLLLRPDVPLPRRKQIAASIALAITKVMPQP